MPLNADSLIRDIKNAYKKSTPSKHVLVPSKPPDSPSSKSTADARKLREIGNKLHKAQKFEDALRLYTMSIAYALVDSEELAKAYGNRSAALFEWGKYALCLLDINRALESHCPAALRQKLLDRKERCLARLKSSAGSCGDVDMGEVDEDATNPPPDQEPIWRADLLSKFGNPLLPNASPKIKLKYDKKWGRHWVATADINTGEPLISEEYFVTIAFSMDSRVKFCDFCATLCDGLIPCLGCAKTMYCSENCRIRAHDSYHRIECKLSFSIPYGDVKEAIATRMFLIGTEQGAALENLMNTLSISDIFVENFDFTDKPTRSDYLTALRLTHGAFDPAHVKSLMKKAVDVIVELRKFKFFESVSADRLKDTEVFATALLINNYSRRFLNMFNINDFTLPLLEKGSLCDGLMLLQYMFNHSCYPNVCDYRWKREHIVHAVRPIKKDEQIFSSYSQDFVTTPKVERTILLDFTCRCEACRNNWPTYMESGILSMITVDDIQRKMMADLIIPCNDAALGPNPVLSEIMNVVAPLLDDTTLMNLRTGEIFRIIADTMSLLYKVMGPQSLAIIELRHYFLFFFYLYYGERELDRSQNTRFEFPESTRKSREELAMFGHTIPKKIFHSHFIATLFDAITKLRFYKLGKFIKDKVKNG